MKPTSFFARTCSYGARPYQTSISRHNFSVLANGFNARELDADDFEFLEKVRERGIANGELPNTSVVSLEELEFWAGPYAVAPEVERRAGPVPRPIATAEQQALRRARTGAWHARRVIREQERAIAAAELEREREAWEQAKAQRRRQDAVTDREWEAAAPYSKHASAKRKRNPAARLAFGKVVDRHYVPQWRVDDQIEARIEKVAGKIAEARLAKLAKQAAEAAKPAEAAERQAEATAAPGPPAWLVKARHLKAKADARAAAKAEAARVEAELAADARARAELAKAELERRNAIIAEARRTVDEHTRFIAEQQAGAPAGTSYTFASLKQAMMTLIRASRPHVWRREALANTLGCDRAMLDRCADELVRDGFLHWREPADAQG